MYCLIFHQYEMIVVPLTLAISFEKIAYKYQFNINMVKIDCQRYIINWVGKYLKQDTHILLNQDLSPTK